MKRGIAYGMLFLAVAGAVNAASSGKDKQKALDKAHYSAYQGPQLAWPTTEAASVKTIATKYGVTIYRSLPPKPYEIMGLIQIARGEHTVHRAADAAKAAGADAILACPDDAFVKAGITTPLSLTTKGEKASDISALTGLLIRWKLSSQ